ncbi:16173_t:CDS:2, partial [Racocetra fulgida]
AALIKILKTNKPIISLNLSYNRLEMGKNLNTSENRLADLELSNNIYKQNCVEGKALFGDALQENKTLKRLDLSLNYIHLEAGRKLFKALKCNQIASEMGEDLLKALKDNSIVFLVEALEENKSLEELDLSHIVEVGEVGKELKNSLEKKSKIQNFKFKSLLSAIKALENALLKDYTISNL